MCQGGNVISNLTGQNSSIRIPKSQFFNLDAESEIIFSLENKGASLEHIEKRLQNAITQLKTGHLLSKSLYAMSGGEKQMIAFACAWAAQPRLLVLDEPSSNLDTEAIERIHRFKRNRKNHAVTVSVRITAPATG